MATTSMEDDVPLTDSNAQLLGRTQEQNRGQTQPSQPPSLRPCCLENFRQAAGLPRIYRCGSTDGLADIVVTATATTTTGGGGGDDTDMKSMDDSGGGDRHPPQDLQFRTTTTPQHKEEELVLHETGLILDLRSQSERNEAKARAWMMNASSSSSRNASRRQMTWNDSVPARPFSAHSVDPNTHVLLPWTVTKQCNQNKQQQPAYDYDNRQRQNRVVLRIDVLSPTRFGEYASDQWFTPTQKAMSKFVYSLVDANKIHELKISALNQRGLVGLNQVILETGGRELCIALQEISNFFEQTEEDEHQALPRNVVIHCVQGKDRTGMLVLLCQSIVGLSDEEIVQDYHLSHAMRGTLSAAGSNVRGTTRKDNDEVKEERASVETTRQHQGVKRGKLDRAVFAGAPREACVGALDFLRAKYGSVSPGYLDSIGFDESWRQRFRLAVLQEQVPSLQSKL